MDSSFPPGESGAKISSTRWLCSPLELPHYLNVPSSRRSSFGSFFYGPAYSSSDHFHCHSLNREIFVTSLNKSKEDWETQCSDVSKKGGEQISEDSQRPRGVSVSSTAVMFLLKLPQMHSAGFSHPFDVDIIHISILVLYIHLNSIPTYAWCLRRLSVDALLSLQTQYVQK